MIVDCCHETIDVEQLNLKKGEVKWVAQREILIDKIDQEFAEYMAEIVVKPTAFLIRNADMIAEMKFIRECIKDQKIISTDEEIEYFLNIEKPLRTICSFADFSFDLYDGLSDTITYIMGQDLQNCNSLIESNIYSTELVEKIETEYSLYECEIENSVSTTHKMNMDEIMRYISNGFVFQEFDAETLLQFKKPLHVLSDLYTDIGATWNETLKNIMKNIYQRDILTLPYELDREKIMPETYSRHQAINEIIEIVPDPDFKTMMKWLDLYRFVYVEGVEREQEDLEPYSVFVQCLKSIKNQFGDNILQQVYNMGQDNPVSEDELIYVAEYLQLGGDAADICHKMNTGEWDAFRQECEKNGMNLY